MSEHHPSCRPSDRDLVWHCNQCGLNEPAEDELTKLREELEAWRRGNVIPAEEVKRLRKEFTTYFEEQPTEGTEKAKAAAAKIKGWLESDDDPLLAEEVEQVENFVQQAIDAATAKSETRCGELREEVKNTLEALVEITKCNTDLQRIISDLHIDIAKLREAPLVEGSPSVRIGPLPLSGETPQSVYPPHRGTADSTGHGQPL